MIDPTKLEGGILARLGQAALWRAAHIAMKPLIERARVTEDERKRGLKPVRLGHTEAELVALENVEAHYERVAVALQNLVAAGKVECYSLGGGRTGYKLTAAPPEVSPREAAQIARLLLAERRWPAAKIDSLVAALTKDAPPDEKADLLDPIKAE